MSDPAVTVRVETYEVDGRSYQIGEPRDVLMISSHWNYIDRVVLSIGDHSYTVLAADLADAAQRARKPR